MEKIGKQGRDDSIKGQYKTWTLDSGLDCGLDCGLDSGLKNGLGTQTEIQSPGVKGHVHINQQQSFVYSIICRLQNLLPKSIHSNYNYTDWNLYIYSYYTVVISPAGMIDIRATAMQCRKAHVCPLPIHIACTSCMLDRYPCPFNTLQCHTPCTFSTDSSIQPQQPPILILICMYNSRKDTSKSNLVK